MAWTGEGLVVGDWWCDLVLLFGVSSHYGCLAVVAVVPGVTVSAAEIVQGKMAVKPLSSD